MSSAGHHAAGPALGYIFQFQIGLLRLTPLALAAEEGAVSLEVFDDVAFHADRGAPKEVLQIHHSVKSRRELLDTSAKVWRTLAIWAEEWKTLEPDEKREMTLISTQRARDGTGLAALRAVDRDLDHAQRMLMATALDPNGAKGTKKDRETFAALDDVDRRALLSRITLADGQLGTQDARARLEKLLAPTHALRYVPAIADAVEGWWWSRVVRGLDDGGLITADELRAKIDDARATHLDGGLPIERHLSNFDPQDIPDVAGPMTFKACLVAIDVSESGIERATDDFLRASAHRSYWTRRLLVGPDELDEYDAGLLTEWDLRCDRALSKMAGGASDVERVEVGRALYDELLLDVRASLRPQVTQPFIQRGSLHGLAEDERLAWHPDAVGPFRAALRLRSAA